MKCKFIHKELKRYNNCTVCTLDCAVNLNFMCTEALEWAATHLSIKCYRNGNTMHFTVQGKAKCSLMDSYDPTTGNRLAESRAKIKAYKFCNTYISKQIRKLSKVYDEVISDQHTFINFLKRRRP